MGWGDEIRTVSVHLLDGLDPRFRVTAAKNGFSAAHNKKKLSEVNAPAVSY